MNTTNKDYFTFNVHNSALIVGQTGSGKSELVRSYVRRLEQAFSPEQMKYILYDLKQVEFDSKYEGGAKEEYLYTSVRTGTEDDMAYLEQLAELAVERAGEDTPTPLLFIYIEECDMAFIYPDRFNSTVMKINTHAKAANMKLMYSTSRPSLDIITEEFRDSFDLLLVGRLASEVDSKTMGVMGGTDVEMHSFIVKENR